MFLGCKSGGSTSGTGCTGCYTMFIYPYDGAVLFGNSPVAGISLHGREVTGVIIYVFSGEMERIYEAEVRDGRRWTATIDTRIIPDGLATFRAVSFDASGERSEDSVRVTIRNRIFERVEEIQSLLPTFSSFLIPHSGQVVFGMFPVIGLSLHPSTVTRVTLEISDGRGVKVEYSLRATNVWMFMWNTAQFSEGVWTLRAYAVDDSGRESQAQTTAVVSYNPVTMAGVNLNILPILYGGGITSSWQVTYPVIISYPFEGTVTVLYPFDGMSLSRAVCGLNPGVCWAFGFYLMPEQVTGVVFLVDGVSAGNVERFPSHITYPAMGTYVVKNWIKDTAQSIRVRARVFSLEGKFIESRESRVNLAP